MTDNEKLTEFQTRKIYIDKALEKRGWVIKDKKQVAEEYLIDWAKDKQGNPVNERFVDYLLFDNQGDPLAVVEAKKYSRNPFEGKEQAEEYVEYLKQKFNKNCFIFPKDRLHQKDIPKQLPGHLQIQKQILCFQS